MKRMICDSMLVLGALAFVVTLGAAVEGTMPLAAALGLLAALPGRCALLPGWSSPVQSAGCAGAGAVTAALPPAARKKRRRCGRPEEKRPVCSAPPLRGMPGAFLKNVRFF